MKINSYSEKYPKIFEKKKRKILNAYSDCNVYHIGSTSVPGLGGKGIIDILITIKNWEQEKQLIKALKNIGYTHIHERENNRRFISKEPPIKAKQAHLHITIEGSKDHKRLIEFRDLLRNNSEIAKEYFKLKEKLSDKSADEYTKMKGEYIKKVLKNNDIQ